MNPSHPMLQLVGDEVPELSGFWGRRELFSWCWRKGAATLIPPGLILAEVLARVTIAAGHKARIPGYVGDDAPLNSGFVLAGGSGGGKTAAAKIVNRSVTITKGGQSIAIHRAGIGTGEGVAAQYGQMKDGLMEWRRRGVLFQADEAEAMFAVAGRAGNNVMSVLRSLLSGAPIAFSYRQNEVNLPGGQYSAAVIISGQPVKLAKLLSDDEIALGTPQRFLWLSADFYDVPEHDVPDPGELTIELPPEHGMAGIAFPDGVRPDVRGNRRTEMRGKGAPLDSHAMLTRLKTAALLALADGRATVDERDWGDAEVLVTSSIHTQGQVMAKGAEHNRRSGVKQGRAEGHRKAESDDVRAAAARLRIAKRIHVHVFNHEPGEFCTRKCLREFLGRDRVDLDAAAKLAEDNLWVVRAKRPSLKPGGKPVEYWLSTPEKP